MKPALTVTVFGSSRPRETDAEYRLAYEVGWELARAGFIVCNGGFSGTMEASARGAKKAGGSTVGVTCPAFGSRGANNWIDRELPEPSLLDRLNKLIALGDAYVILKGGTGTLLELAAVWEFMNKGILAEKPIVTVGTFWNGVVSTLKDELSWEGLADCTRFVLTAGSATECAESILDRLEPRRAR
jgi:uncharacterized protein (TIGR00730 family)